MPARLYLKIGYERYRLLLIFFVVTAMSLALVLHQVNSVLVEQASVNATQEQLAILARAGAISINSLFVTFKVSLVNLADLDVLTSGSREQIYQALMHSQSLIDIPVTKQFGVVSRDGTLLVVAASNGSREGEGISLADRSYFQWAKTAKKGELFLSGPIIARAGANKGKWVVILATPIIKNGVFVGVAYASVPAEDIRSSYIDKLQLVIPPTVTYMINQDGLAIASPFTTLVGIDVRQYAAEKKWPGYKSYLQTIDMMTTKQEGRSVYYFMGTDQKVQRWVSAYAPAEINKGAIILAVATPYKQAEGVATSFYNNQALWLIFLIAVGVLFCLFYIIGVYAERRLGYNKGLKEGYHLAQAKETK